MPQTHRSKKKPGTYRSKNTAVIPNIFYGPPDPTFFSYFLEPKNVGAGPLDQVDQKKC